VKVGPASAFGDIRVLTEAPMNAPEGARSYEIRVLGVLDARWSAWFAGLDVSSSAVGETTLTGPLRDQTELHGVLARVRDLGLQLVEVRRLDRYSTCAAKPNADRHPVERIPQMAHDQIPELVRRWADAESRSDADALDALMTDDCTLIGPAGFVLNRQQCLDRYRSGGLKTEAFSWSDVNVREYDTTTVVVGIVTQQASFQGQDASGRFRVTQIAVQQDGRWKCAGLQFSGPIRDMPQRPA
jgi:ketosteroid isomerase-like protein